MARAYANSASNVLEIPAAPGLPETEPGQLPTRVVPIRDGVSEARPAGLKPGAPDA